MVVLNILIAKCVVFTILTVFLTLVALFIVDENEDFYF
jgi:hypothetical protein